MVRWTAVSLPEDEYLINIGQLAYAVGYLEWLVLGELPALAAAVPADLTVEKLAGQATGTIAGRLQTALSAITSPAVHAFIAQAAGALAAVSAVRNHVLHARPATIDRKQRLYRWKLGGAPATFAIADEWLDQRLAEIDEWIRKVSALRKPAKAAVASP